MSTFDTSREGHLVLDKNVLRAAAATAAKAQADAAGLGVLVIDTTFKEIARGGNWPTHYENDFCDWTDKPQRMSVSWGIGELLREERKTSKIASVVDGPMTARHRQLLIALAAGDRAALIAAGPQVSAETSRMSGPGGALDAAGRLALMRGMTDVWWKHGSDAVRKVIAAELNDPVDGPLIRLGQIVMTDTSLRTTLQSSLEQTGCSAALAAALLQAPTFTNFLHSAFEAYSLILWAHGQKLDGVNAEKFLNQMLDLDYVAYGLCCAGLVTNERIIRRMEAGLRNACQLLWP
jgi:hypothetical protein